MIRLLILDDDAASALKFKFYAQVMAPLRGEQQPRFVVRREGDVEQARQLVTNAIEQFDIFLINLPLKGKAGKHARDLDGIEVIKELHRVSPSTDAIIMIDDFNPNSVLRAYRAGASRCLPKQSTMIAELVFTLRSVYEKRRAEEERQWLKILNQVAEETQLSQSVKEVAQVVVEGGLRLGFKQARLWLLNNSKEELVGITQANTQGLGDLSQVRIPIEQSVYTQQILSHREPIFFHGLELGEAYLYNQYADQGFKSPVGEWVSIPLWSSDHCLGMLTLDNADKRTNLRSAQRDFLRLLGKQVSAVVERVLILEQKERVWKSTEADKLERERELTWLQAVSEEALTPQADEPRVIKMLLNATYGLLNIPRVRVEVVLRAWEKPNGAKGEPREVRSHYWISPNGELKYQEVKDIYSGIIGEVLREGRAYLVEDVRQTKWASYYEKQAIRSQLTVLIRSDAQIIGVLSVMAPQPGALTESHQQILNRLVGVASLALDNVLRQKHLYDVFRATKAVTKPLNLRPTLDAITEALFDTSPSLSALTIWYKEPEDERLKLGSCYGIRDEAALNNMPDEEMEVVRRVMNADPEKGIWIENAAQTFGSRFMEREQIKSCAAFPLFANDERVGAMFLFYRLRHKFTAEQRGLFPILAASVAASILNAARLELVRRERRRFQAAAAITEKVGTSFDLSDTLHKVMSVLREELFPDTHICVMTYDQQKQALLFTPVSKAFYQIERKSGANRTHLSPKESTLAYFREFLAVALNQPSIATRVAKASLRSKKVEVANVADVTTDPDYLPAITSTRSKICISLMGSQKWLFGVLVLESPRLNRFDAEDEILLLHMSRKISLAMEHVYQSANLQFQTTVAAATSWAAQIAHDLNSEMGLIRNRLDWLREDEQLSESGLIYIQDMQQSLSRLDRPLASVKAFQSERPQKVSVKPWIKDAVSTIIADKHRTEDTFVTFDITFTQLTINVTSTALRRAMRYLINNALDQIEGQTSGRLVIRGRVLESAATSAGKQGQKIEIQIEDSGSGVDDTIRQTLFQQPRSTKGTKGHGFGLLFARHLIEQMGGTLYLIEPTTLNGACFAFTLPIGKQK